MERRPVRLPILRSYPGCCIFLIYHVTSGPVACFSTVSVMALLVAVLAADLINLERRDTLWDYPAWQLALAVMAVISLSLKVLAVKLVNCFAWLGLISPRALLSMIAETR